MGSNRVDVSILQYADDTIFFGETSQENVRAIKAILRIFEIASGLKINFAKSCFGAFGMPERWKSDAASWLNCSLMSIPFTYLGIPIGMSLKQLLHAMKHRHRHGYRTRHGHGHGHVDTCNVQNIERSTGVVSDTDTDACRTQTRQGTGVSVLHREGLL